MKFSDLTKRINTDNYTINNIKIYNIRAQYNPDRFKFWKSLHKGPLIEALNMLYSPHYSFLVDQQNWNHKESDYYKLQSLYGRNHKWITKKIDLFLDTFRNIKTEGCKDMIIVLGKPIVKNPYNSSFEIFEGHHRVACSLAIGLDDIPCMVIR